jgi:hypothetical protein
MSRLKLLDFGLFVAINVVDISFSLQGVHPCDKRRTISENRSRFPTIDFSLVCT